MRTRRDEQASRKLTTRTRAGQTLSYAYDNLDRLLGRTGPALADRSYAYDNADRRTQVKDMSGVTVVAETDFTFDNANRVTRERRNDWGLNVDYTYDQNGNRATVKWPDAFTVNYAYDAADRMSTISAGAIVYRDFAYDSFSRRGKVSTISDGNPATQAANEVVTTYA